jgi:putative addiction module component (TIGR02574 family)
MSANALAELNAFRQFLDEQIEQGRVHSSPEQVVELWRRQQGLRESTMAVRQALSEMDAGDLGQPLDEFLDEFRTRPMLTEAQRGELQRRLEEHEANPDDVVPWEQIRDDALRRHGQ